jgi:hypothetical protein
MFSHLIIGHDLEEIRVRALCNILNKLEAKVIKEQDLIQQQDFYVNILKWFKFRTVPMKKEALSLLVKLLKVIIYYYALF